MFIVVNEEDFAEAVDIAAESFVQYFLAHISKLKLGDDGEKGVKSSNLHRITRFPKIVTVLL